MINEIGDQVDKYEYATHFLCLNNSGEEHQYKVSLFNTPEVPKLTLDQFTNLISIDKNNWDDVNINFTLGVDLNVIIFSALEDKKMNSFSYGVAIGVGLNDTYDNIYSELSDEVLSYFADGVNKEDIINVIFRKFLQYFIETAPCAIILFSNNFENHKINRVLDEIAQNSTETFRNPNMEDSIIKVWTIYKIPEEVIEDPYNYEYHYDDDDEFYDDEED